MRHMLQPHVGARADATSALAHWKLNEASGSALDSVGAYTLTATGSPGAVGSLFAVPSGATGARTFDGSTQYFSASGATAFVDHFTANHCFSAVFKPDVVTGTRTIFAYTTLSETLATNALLVLRLSGDEIGWIWEYGSGTNVTQTTSGLSLVAGKTYLATIAVDDASNGSATACDVRLYVFEKGAGLIYEQTWTNQTRAAGGTSSAPAIGYDPGTPGNYFDGTIDDVVLWSYPLSRDAALLLYAETFGIAYDEETLYGTGAASYHMRVRVEDADGVLRDLSDLVRSHDFVLSAEISDDIDSPGATATVAIAREVEDWKLGRDVTSSPLNLDSGGSYGPLLNLNRRILIDTAVLPEGFAPNAWDWVPLFDGFIGAVDWGADEISIEAVDRMGPLFDTFIAKEPLEIISVADTGTGSTLEIETVAPHGLSAGDKIGIYETTAFNGQWTVASVISTTEIATVESISGSPVPETSGLLFGGDLSSYGSASGVPVETVIQEIIDDNVPADNGTIYGYIGGTPTLYTPTSPSFDILPYYQKREPVQTALETLAAMFGWNVKFRWHSAVREFRLTLYSPDRTITTPQHTFTTDEILEVTRASIDGKQIRNAVEVIYSDSNDVDENGHPRRVLVRRSDSSSINAYGYRLCAISEASASQIDTYDEAVDLADAVLADLKEPKADIAVEMPFRRFVDLADYYRLPADGYHWDAAKDVAVVGYAHSFADGEATTTLTLRGKPASMNGGWSIRMVAPGMAPNQPTTSPIAPGLGPNLTALAGGVDIYSPFPNDIRARNLDTVEIHVSDLSGFTPDASSYRQMSRGNRARIFDLDPSKTHYVRTQFRDRFGNISAWSPESSIVPRYTLSKPAARAYRGTSAQDLGYAANTPVANVAVQFNDEAFDIRSNYDTGNYWWDCPVDGVYHVDAMVSIEFTSANSANSGRIQVYRQNNTPAVILQGATYTEIQHTIISNCDVEGAFYASQGDRIQIRITTTGKGAKTTFGAANTSTTYVNFNLVSQDDPP